MSALPSRTLIVTGCASNFMAYAGGLIRSIEAFPQRASVDIACFDLGLSDADRNWFSHRGIRTVPATTHLGVPETGLAGHHRGYLARMFMRDYFPGYDVYIWIDSDIWLQRWSVIEKYRSGALATGLAVAHERERAYQFQAWLFAWTAKHMLLGYPPLDAAWLLTRPHLNAGMFALAADAPHWHLWTDAYTAAYRRSGRPSPHDQFALNHAVHGGVFARPAAETTLLPPSCNWICDRGPPMWNDVEAAFCEPYAPHRVIGTMHLAGPAKGKTYNIQRTGGGWFATELVYGAQPEGVANEAGLLLAANG